MDEEAKLAYAIARQRAAYERSGTIGGAISGITYGIMGAIVGGLWYWSFTTVYQYTNVDPGNAACMAATIIAPLIFYTFNDLFACIYMTIYNVAQGRGRDLIQSLKTKPALIIMLAGIIGGPVGQGFFYLGFPTDAAAFAGPISALYVIFGILLGRLILHQVKADSWRFESARERYERFLREFPTVAHRASVNDMASYLLMTPESLSRVRKAVAKEGRNG